MKRAVNRTGIINDSNIGIALSYFKLHDNGLSDNRSPYWFCIQQVNEPDCTDGDYNPLIVIERLCHLGNNYEICVCSEESDYCEAIISFEEAVDFTEHLNMSRSRTISEALGLEELSDLSLSMYEKCKSMYDKYLPVQYNFDEEEFNSIMNDIRHDYLSLNIFNNEPVLWYMDENHDVACYVESLIELDEQIKEQMR